MVTCMGETTKSDAERVSWVMKTWIKGFLDTKTMENWTDDYRAFLLPATLSWSYSRKHRKCVKEASRSFICFLCFHSAFHSDTPCVVSSFSNWFLALFIHLLFILFPSIQLLFFCLFVLTHSSIHWWIHSWILILFFFYLVSFCFHQSFFFSPLCWLINKT